MINVVFFCPGNKCEVRESRLCSLPGVNMSKVGHAPKMCFLKHLYVEYLTSSRPEDLNQQGIMGSFLEPDTPTAACQWWGMLHVQNSTWIKLHYCTPAFPIIAASVTSWSAWATLHFQTINCVSKNVWRRYDWGTQDTNNIHFNCFFLFQTATFFPHPLGHQCLGWDKEECFLLSRSRGKGYLVYQ